MSIWAQSPCLNVSNKLKSELFQVSLRLKMKLVALAIKRMLIGELKMLQEDLKAFEHFERHTSVYNNDSSCTQT